MCKVLVVPSIVTNTEEKAYSFIKAMGRAMTAGNTDGLGYAAFDGEGNLFGERWLRNYEAFNERSELTQLDYFLMDEHKGFIHKEDKYNKFGQIKESNIRAMILHTRFATSAKGLLNNHPHVDGDTALIHNGVVDVKKGDLKKSSCDSEKILNLYTKFNTMNKPTNIRKVASNLEGYFACAVLSKQRNGTPILDVFKDSTASLHAAYINELGTMVFSTSASDLKEVCEKEKLTIGSFFTVKDNMMIRFNVLTGKVMNTVRFKSTSRRVVKHYHGNWWNEEYPGVDPSWRDDFENGRDSLMGDVARSEEVLTGTSEPKTNEEKTAQAVLRMATNGQVNDGWRYNEATKVWYQVK